LTSPCWVLLRSYPRLAGDAVVIAQVLYAEGIVEHVHVVAVVYLARAWHRGAKRLERLTDRELGKMTHSVTGLSGCHDGGAPRPPNRRLRVGGCHGTPSASPLRP
jgi:hypothetical protein